MRVFVPFTRLRPQTYAALPTATFVPLLDREYDYGRYFQKRWADRLTFINVEHDIVPDPEILEEMWACPETFCLSGYHYPNQPGRVDIAYLGCAKISKELIEAHQDVYNEVRHWTNCDTGIWQATGETYHQHGSVLHLHVDSLWPESEVNKWGR